MPPGKRNGPLPPQQALFLFGGSYAKSAFFRHTAQERRDNTPPPPRTCVNLSMSTSDSELPQARLVPCGHAPRIAWGATPADVRWPLDEHERSELPQARLVPRGHAPRIARGATPATCADLSMSTSEASCHRRDLSRAATRRELPGVQPPRTCAGLSMSTSGSELPQARLVPRGHAPRIARGATPADVRWPLDEHERSELPKARLVPRGHAPRIARGCNPREVTAQGTGPADEKTENFTFAPFLPLPFLHPSPADRRPSAPAAEHHPGFSPYFSRSSRIFGRCCWGTSGYTP